MIAIVALSQERRFEQSRDTPIDPGNQTVESPQLIPRRTDFIPNLIPSRLVFFKFGRSKFSNWTSAEVDVLLAAVPPAGQVEIAAAIASLPAHNR
jgi:hypothetical protein